MEAIYRDHDGVNTVRIVGVLYGARVQIRFEGSGEVVVPVSLLELDDVTRSELDKWLAMPGPGSFAQDEYGVLDVLSAAGAVGLLDTQYPWPRKQVETARRSLRHKGLVGPADGRPAAEGDGRAVRWRLTRQGVLEHRIARGTCRPIARGGGRQLSTAVGG